MTADFQRHIQIDFVGNLRDLGGYSTRDGRTVAWRKLFRSAEPKLQTPDDIAELRRHTGVFSILDLRGEEECQQERIDLLKDHEIGYYNVPLIEDVTGPGYDRESIDFEKITDLGEFYLAMIAQQTFPRRLAEALELIADQDNHPVLFHCAVGKDRTGILAATVLNILGVSDEDIIADYHLTEPNMPAFLENLRSSGPEGAAFVDSFPSFMWGASQRSMEIVLSGVRKRYGSFRNFLEKGGCDRSLFTRIETTLLA